MIAVGPQVDCRKLHSRVDYSFGDADPAIEFQSSGVNYQRSRGCARSFRFVDYSDSDAELAQEYG
jgi:hypothetical protein